MNEENSLNKLVENYDLKLEKLEQLALKHHIDNFNEIVSKCNNSFE